MFTRIYFGLFMLLAVGAAHAAHTLTIYSTQVVGTSVYLDTFASGVLATGVVFEARICDATGANPIVGSQHTFTSLETPHRFLVENVPANVLASNYIVSVTEDVTSTGCNPGDQGYYSAVNELGRGPVLPPVPAPALPFYGLLLLGGLLGLLGVRKLKL